MRITSLNDRAVKLSTAKVYVFTDSVLCLGKVDEYPRSINSWKGKRKGFTQSSEYRELGSVDGEPVMFEWKIFPGRATLKFFQEIQRTMGGK